MEEVIEGVAPILCLCLAEDIHDDFALDDAEASRMDCSLQLLGAALDDGRPVIAATVGLVHGELCARAVLVAGVLRQDCADQGIENGGGVSAAGDGAWGDDGVGTFTFAVEGCEDAMGERAFLRCWMGECWERRCLGMRSEGLEFASLEDGGLVWRF